MRSLARKTTIALISLALTVLAALPGSFAAGDAPVGELTLGGAPALCWTVPDKAPEAALLCLHGLGLHKGCFSAFGKRMAQNGIVTYAVDLPSFGENKGDSERLDFDASMKVVGAALEQIHQQHPRLPLFLAGESMGGAMALHATATFPDRIAGLISSVPSGDRFNAGATTARVAQQVLKQGFDKPMPVGDIVVLAATQDPDLRAAWLNDPQARLALTPRELMRFQSFMNDNFSFARKIERTPVLFIQGSKDKLVRPAGTWDLFDYLNTPDRQRVLSTTAEHLILEESQFSDDDFKYVLSWIERRIPKQQPAAVAGTTSGGEDGGLRSEAGGTPALPGSGSQSVEGMALDYWIELLRDGKIYRCNNKTVFQSGDEIRFHFIPQNDGYAYIIMSAGSTGNQAILFPNEETGTDNRLRKGRDYALPTMSMLKFDEHPGIERISLVFSPYPVDAKAYLASSSGTIAYLSPDRSGAKDIVPTRMKLTWDEAAPIIIPEQVQQRLAGSSMIRIAQNEPDAVLAVQIALEHR